MLKKCLVAMIFFFMTLTSAFSDQAAWIKKSDAYKAGEMINSGTVLRAYCAPCGDTKWTDLPVKQVEVKNADAEFYQVFINGKGIDLAYVYTEQEGKWVNLAMLLGLDVSDAPKFLPEPNDADSESEVHLIDNILNQCMAKDSSNANMVNCHYEAYELWDAELNKVYNQLRVRLTPKQQKALKIAQLGWIKYRDLEFKLIGSVHGSLQGSMYKLIQAAERMDIVRERTLRLRSYTDLLEGH
ncbi:MAG: hypothetical protein DRI57_03465 [Deltaproteobacteria bacterium]|nr:MAG: hypothetical protein DRI57_03465 [Deltaproteobacteria bacterium]